MADLHRGDLAALIINLRAVSGRDTAVLAGIEDGSVTKLSRDKAIVTARYAELAEHEKAFVRAYAVGLGAHSAMLTGFAAARMHGMWVAGHARDPVELGLAEIPPKKQWNPGTVYRRLNIRDDKIVEVGGVRTPRLFRIFAEIARHHGLPDGLVAADWLRGQGMSYEAMGREANLLGRYRGITTVREAIQRSVPHSDSPFEPYARGLLLEAGLTVTAQAPLCGGRYFGDILVGERTVVEIDGDVKYGGRYGETGEVLLAEKKRENAIRNNGYSVLRYSPAQLLRDPEGFAAQVKAEAQRQQRSA